jgi:hypothetical protein
MQHTAAATRMGKTAGAVNKVESAELPNRRPPAISKKAADGSRASAAIHAPNISRRVSSRFSQLTNIFNIGRFFSSACRRV